MPININLACRSVEQTRSFYQTLQGFEIFDTAMDTLTVEFEDCTLIFFESGADDPEPNFTGTFYLFVRDVENCWATLRDVAAVQWPLQNMSYGTREFAIRDCNGYRLAFAQSGAD